MADEQKQLIAVKAGMISRDKSAPIVDARVYKVILDYHIQCERAVDVCHAADACPSAGLPSHTALRHGCELDPHVRGTKLQFAP